MPRVLFIDDEVHARHHYVQALEYSGHTVKVCSVVDDANAIVRSDHFPFDLIILDVMMPPGNVYAENGSWADTGIRFFEDIARMNLSVPVIIFTNVDLQDVRASLPKRGYLEIHSKASLNPIQLSDLIEKLCSNN